MDTSRISHTAHYTGTVWERAGLAHPAMRGATRASAFYALEPAMWIGRPLVGGLDLEAVLVQRHRIIDAVLCAAIEDGRISQVVEIAAGLSSRGLRLSERYPGLTYIEGDLPGMVAMKRARLEAAGLSLPNHRLTHLNALVDSGPESLSAITSGLAAGEGTAVITEGLLNYFDRPAVEGIWARTTQALARFPRGLYLSDIRLDESATNYLAVRAFMLALSVIARGRVHSHYGGPPAAVSALRAAGFSQARLHAPADWATRLSLPVGRRGDLLHVIEAWADA